MDVEQRITAQRTNLYDFRLHIHQNNTATKETSFGNIRK